MLSVCVYFAKEKRIHYIDGEYILIFHDRGFYHIETSPVICSANQ